MKTARFTLGCLVAVLALAVAAPALAQTLDQLNAGLGVTADAAQITKVGGDQLPAVVGRVINGLFGAVGVGFLLWLLVGAYAWLTSGGSEERVLAAKKKIIAAIDGIIVTFLAYALTFLVTNSLSNALQGGAGT